MPAPTSSRLVEVAELQCGVVTRSQARAAGVTKSAIQAHLDGGRWQRVYPGVLAVFSGQLPRLTTLSAAVLRVGPDATLSHYTAAELAELTPRPSRLIHVTVPTDRRVDPIPGVVVHRSGRAAQARHPSHSPPRTRVEETVLDLTQLAPTFDQAYGWLCRACGSRLTTAERLAAAMTSRQRLRWRADLEAVLADAGQGSHSALEYRYLNDVERAHRLPPSMRQARVRRGTRSEYRDLAYDDYAVVVETDGRTAHPAGERWRDVRRDNAAAAEGITTLRYNWADVTTRPCAVAREVAAALSARGWRGHAARCGPACALVQISAEHLACSSVPNVPR